LELLLFSYTLRLEELMTCIWTSKICHRLATVASLSPDPHPNPHPHEDPNLNPDPHPDQ
jgi:hypothetical protein